MIRAKKYETVSKFVEVMTKILWPLFFPDTVYFSQLKVYIVPLGRVLRNFIPLFHERTRGTIS